MFSGRDGDDDGGGVDYNRERERKNYVENTFLETEKLCYPDKFSISFLNLNFRKLIQ